MGRGSSKAGGGGGGVMGANETAKAMSAGFSEENNGGRINQMESHYEGILNNLRSGEYLSVTQNQEDGYGIWLTYKAIKRADGKFDIDMTSGMRNQAGKPNRAWSTYDAKGAAELLKSIGHDSSNRKSLLAQVNINGKKYNRWENRQF